MQSQRRMVGCRRAFLQKKRAVVAIQSHARGVAARKSYAQLVAQHKAATVVQAHARGTAARKEYKRRRGAVVAIQMGQRRWKVRRVDAHHSAGQGRHVYRRISRTATSIEHTRATYH